MRRKTIKDANLSTDTDTIDKAVTVVEGKRVAKHGSYANITPEKEMRIQDIIVSGISEIKTSVKRDRVRKWDLDRIKSRTFEYLERKVMEKRLPTVEGLAVALGIERRTLYDWMEDRDSKELYEFLTVVREGISNMHTEAAISGQTNTVAWIFYAKNHFGYVDKTEVDVTAKPGHVDEVQDEESIRQRWLLESNPGTEKT